MFVAGGRKAPRRLRAWAHRVWALGTSCILACSQPCPQPRLIERAKAEPAQPRRLSSSDLAEPPSFDISRTELREAGAPEDLLRKLEASPLAYFRLLADEYEVRVCETFHFTSGSLPVVAVHGDAHLEQFVVTDHSYGLEDFDRSGFGPSVVDLVRYAASLHVACAAADFECHPDAAVARYLSAYRAALDAPPAKFQPSIVTKLRGKVPRDRAAWLAWADTRMQPFDAATQEAVTERWGVFVELMANVRPDLPADTFRIVTAGNLQMGIGSALERKMLFRVAGPSDAPGDDLIIEAREGAAPDPRGCVWRPSYGESLILMFAAVLGRRLPGMHGFVPLLNDSERFWVQEWDEGYVELSVSDVSSQAELEELAADAGGQLAEHLWSNFPRQLLAYQLHAQRQAFDSTREQTIALARDLAGQTLAAWERFRQARPSAAPAKSGRQDGVSKR